jgi:pyruvate dehydrogenase E2 component (dihydrolipoamide acetyltransferase)
VTHLVHIPKPGMSAIEADVVDVQVNVGDRVSEGQVLFVISTDKVDVDVNSPVTGTVAAIHIEVESVYPVGFVAVEIAE